MAEFETDKTSGVGPATIKVRPKVVNDTTSDKTATLTIRANGVPKTVSLLQKKTSSQEYYDYEFIITHNGEEAPSTVTVPSKGGFVLFVITSRRRRIVNGVQQGDWENVQFTAEFSDKAPYTVDLIVDNNKGSVSVDITSTNNLEQTLSDSLVISQVDGLYKTINIVQEAAQPSYYYTVEPKTVNIPVGATDLVGSTTFTAIVYRHKLLGGSEVEVIQVPFKIPTIGEAKVVQNNDSPQVSTTYSILDYGNIGTEFMTSFSATARAEQPSISGNTGYAYWSVVIQDAMDSYLPPLTVHLNRI